MFDPSYREPLFKEPRRNLSIADFKDANIGLEYASCSIETIKDYAPYKKTIKKYVDGIHKYERSGIGLILHGGYGAGKTGTAVAVCAEAMKRSGRAWFISSWDIEETFRNSIGWRERAQLCAKKMQFLILDDIGVASDKNKEVIDSTIAYLVRTRYNDALPTIITTNLDIKALFSRYKSLQRLFVAKYKDVNITGTDWVKGVTL